MYRILIFFALIYSQLEDIKLKKCFLKTYLYILSFSCILKSIAVHFQFMNDDMNIIAYHRTLRLLKSLYKLLLYVNESLKYLLVIGFIYNIISDSIRSKYNLI